MKVSIVLGTRPEIIKMSPVIREIERLGIDYFILHSGQHYSYNMDRTFFEQLKLPNAKYNLDIGSGSHAEQTAKILIGIEKVLEDERPSIVLVEGDTNTVLAGALAASKIGIKVGHVEAGLRSWDRSMPEETNRILTDHLADYCFAPTEESRQNLIREGISEEKIFITGNTVVDAANQNLEIAESKETILDDLNIKSGDYCLATVHRQENVDNKERFQGILSGLEKVSAGLSIPIIYPIHPRSRKRMSEFKLYSNGVRLVDPVDYLSFLMLAKQARVVLTDSGGVQEEACTLGVPCVTLRDNTERPETIRVGSNVLAGTHPETIFESTMTYTDKRGCWENPFGDGNAGKRIVEILR